MPSPWTLLLVHLTVATVLSAHLLLRRKEPLATLAWLQGLFLLPGLGALFYLLVGAATIRRRTFRRRRRLVGEFAARLSARGQGGGLRTPPPELTRTAAETLAVAIRTSRALPTRGNEVEVYDSPSEVYDALERAVEAAADHVHFEYYIFQPDETGRRFLELLTRKAKEGVQVRLLLDSVGSRRLGTGFTSPLTAAGGTVGWFLPLGALPPRFALHLRNHRKLAVVDGTVAFTGGVNIGDEYRGRWARKPTWTDTHLRVGGPAVQQLQEVFAEDWFFTTGEELTDDRYFPPQELRGDAIVHTVASGPDDPARALHATLFHAVASARQRVWIATPYFIPDGAILSALAVSAMRGVDVRLLLPERTDHPLVDRAGESFLPGLLEAGVQVFRYEAGMLHSKLVAVDGQWGTLGSANMDIRSFRFNFELNLLVFSPSLARRLEGIFEGDLRHSSAYTRARVAAASLPHRLATAGCRLLAPLL
ncbi:MAG: cardiolipin synthase [Deferrisomatales bacterium]